MAFGSSAERCPRRTPLPAQRKASEVLEAFSEQAPCELGAGGEGGDAEEQPSWGSR